jgi:hypothetical protein
VTKVKRGGIFSFFIPLNVLLFWTKAQGAEVAVVHKAELGKKRPSLVVIDVRIGRAINEIEYRFD